MGQAKQRKALMGDRYGKDPNPWVEKNTHKSLTKIYDYDYDKEDLIMTQIANELAEKSVQRIVCSSESIDGIDFSKLKRPEFQTNPQMFIVDGVRSISQFDHGKNLNPLVAEQLCAAKEAEDYKSLVQYVPTDIVLDFYCFYNGEAEIGVDQEYLEERGIPSDWDRTVALAFLFYSDFVAGIYQSSLERSQEIIDLTLLKACKLLAVALNWAELPDDEEDYNNLPYVVQLR